MQKLVKVYSLWISCPVSENDSNNDRVSYFESENIFTFFSLTGFVFKKVFRLTFFKNVFKKIFTPSFNPYLKIKRQWTLIMLNMRLKKTWA